MMYLILVKKRCTQGVMENTLLMKQQQKLETPKKHSRAEELVCNDTGLDDKINNCKILPDKKPPTVPCAPISPSVREHVNNNSPSGFFSKGEVFKN